MTQGLGPEEGWVITGDRCRDPPEGPQECSREAPDPGEGNALAVSSEGSAGEQVLTLALFLSLASRHAQGCPATVLHTNLLKGAKSQAHSLEVGGGARWHA